MTPRLKELYKKQIRPELKEKFSFKNLYMAPKIDKIVLNMGLGVDGNDNKIIKSCEDDLARGKFTFRSRWFYRRTRWAHLGVLRQVKG